MGAASRTKGKQQTPPPDLEVTVLESVRAAPGVTLAVLKKHVPVSHKKFVTEAIVVSLAERGEVFFLKKGKRVFPSDPFVEIDTKLPDDAAQAPIEKAELKDLVGAAAPGCEAVFESWLKRALSERKLFVHTLGNGKKRIGREPDIGSSLKPVLKALRTAVAKLDAQRVPRERVAAALLEGLGLAKEETSIQRNGTSKTNDLPQGTSTDERRQFLAALETLVSDNPRQALHSVRELRSRLTLSKREFDAIALDLAREGVVSLHHHDHASALPDNERTQLIQDDRGTHFNGIAPRRGDDRAR
ncbi:MAG TPA: hypothetical protein VI197_20020 [Polyangiaceae bacterium]